MRVKNLILIGMMFWLFIMGGCGKKDTVKSVFIPDDSNQEEPGQNNHLNMDSLEYQKNFLIENVVMETPISKVFNIAPGPYSRNEIHGMKFKNWIASMDMNIGVCNDIISQDVSHPFNGSVFDNVRMSGTKLNATNWIETGNFKIENVVVPIFK